MGQVRICGSRGLVTVRGYPVTGKAVKLSSTEDGCVVGMRLPLAAMAELLQFSHPRESGFSKSL